MTLTNPATSHLRVPGAPTSGYDVDVNAAIVRFVEKHGPCSFAQIGEVFLPAAAAGCNAGHVRSLKHRLTFLTTVGRLTKTHTTSWRGHSVRWRAGREPSNQPCSSYPKGSL